MGFIDSTKKKYTEGLVYLKTKKQQFTGETLEHKIDEYTEVYGEILLGMNRELAEVKTKIIKIDEGINELNNKQNEISYSEYQKLKKHSTLAIVISIIAVIASLVIIILK